MTQLTKKTKKVNYRVGKEVRMRLISNCPSIVSAMLTKDVQYTKMGKVITLVCGTVIQLDIDTEICQVEKKDHIQLSATDYNVMMN